MKSTLYKKTLIILCSASIILILIAFAIIFYQIPIRSITRDISATANVHPLTGVLSNLGILFWCAASALCLLSTIIARHTNDKHYRFFLFSTLLSSYLTLDDFFLFHEELARSYLGLRENFIFLCLALAVIIYLVKFRKVILKTNFILLIISFVFLALSVVIDAILSSLLSQLGGWEHFLEDGFKWFGIVFWYSYFFDTSLNFIINVIQSPNKPIKQN